MSKNKYTAQFKAKVSLEALKEDQSIPEICGKYDLHPSVVNRSRLPHLIVYKYEKSETEQGFWQVVTLH